MRHPGPGRHSGRPARLFTHDEANALLPRLIPDLEALRDSKREVDRLRAELETLTPAMLGNGYGADAARIENRLSELAATIRRRVRSVFAQGILIQDIELGLIDFPSEREGRVVLLCWRLGEEAIAYWHELSGGFAGRLAL